LALNNVFIIWEKLITYNAPMQNNLCCVKASFRLHVARG